MTRVFGSLRLMRPLTCAFLCASVALSSVPAFAQQGPSHAVGAGIGLVVALLIALVVGAIVGWVASVVVKGSGSGFWADVLIGIGGSIFASLLLGFMDIRVGGPIGSLLAMFCGAVLLLLIVKAVRRT